MLLTTARLTRRFSLVAVVAGVFGLGALAAACGSASASSTSTTAGSSSASTTSPPAGSSTTGAPATTTTAPPPSTTTTASLTGSECYVGNWTSTNLTQAVEGQQVSGGAGIHFAITSTEMSIDFSGMKPVIISGGSVSGQGIYLGQEQAGVAFAPSGTFSIPSKGTSNVTFEAKIGSQPYSAPIKADGFPTGGISGTYVCSASSLTLKVPTPQGTTTVALTRS
ncbi:MAG: hypothetical protein WAM97_06695 [Acidimicrobiales bacterium]|jgi:hypothetical protein